MTEQQILDTLRDFIEENGYSPTQAELADLLESTPRQVYPYLMALEKKGYIKVGETCRGIKVL